MSYTKQIPGLDNMGRTKAQNDAAYFPLEPAVQITVNGSFTQKFVLERQDSWDTMDNYTPGASYQCVHQTGVGVSAFTYSETSGTGLGVTSIIFDNLNYAGSIALTSSILQTFSAPVIQVAGAFNIASIPSLVTVNMPNLVTLGSSLTISNSVMTTLTLTSLKNVLGSVASMPSSLNDGSYLLPALAYVSGNFGPTGNARQISLTFANLQCIVGNLSPSLLSSLVTLTLNGLTYLGGNFVLGANLNSLVTVSVNSLQTIGGNINFSNTSLTNLANLQFPALTTLGGYIGFSHYRGTQIYFPNVTSIGGFSFGSSCDNANIGTLSLPNCQYINENSLSMTLNVNYSSLAISTFSLPNMINYCGVSGSGGLYQFQILGVTPGQNNLYNITLGTPGILKVFTKYNGLTITSIPIYVYNQATIDNLFTLLASLDGTNGTTLWTGQTLNLYIDGDYVDGHVNHPTLTGGNLTGILPVAFSGNGSKATVALTNTTGFVVGQYVTVGGLSGANSGYNGTYVITDVNTNTNIKYASTTTGTPATGTASLTSGNILTTTTHVGSAFSGDGTTCTVSWTSHGFSAGQVIQVSGMTGTTGLNGTVQILTASTNSFTYSSVGNGTGTGTATVITAEGWYYYQKLLFNGTTVTF